MSSKTIFKTKAEDVTSAILGIAPDSSNIVVPISEGPHFLVAGTTGSGKSVFINSLAISMMVHSHPDELKLTIIDPKTVEFTGYKGLPYMLCDPLTDMSKANNFVLYLVEEMERRYDLFAKYGVKKLADYQEKQRENDKMEKLPYIILIIDEFADLISQYKDVEKPIARIGQKARAAGIHMIIATQSPRREVITGLIKANVPSRVSLMVANSTESQIILDETGGEKLRPKGDFLLKMNGGQVSRGQAPFVSDDEIKDIFDYLRETYDAPKPIDFEAELQRMLEAKGENGDVEDINESASKFHGSGHSRKDSKSHRRPGQGISTKEKEKNARMREKIEENKKNEKKPPIKRTVSGNVFANKEARQKARKEKGVNHKTTSASKMTNTKQTKTDHAKKNTQSTSQDEIKVTHYQDREPQSKQKQPQRTTASNVGRPKKKPQRSNQLINQTTRPKKETSQSSKRPTAKRRPVTRTRPTSPKSQSRTKN